MPESSMFAAAYANGTVLLERSGWMPFRRLWCTLIPLFLVGTLQARQFPGKEQFAQPSYITSQPTERSFTIVAKGTPAPVFIDPADWKGVIRAAGDLGDDIRKVSGTAAPVNRKLSFPQGAILIGTIGKSRIIDQLVADKKIDVAAIKGQWESYLIQTVNGNLVIAGSDKRGTIYGIYDLSEKIGVSPWYWWADAPVKKSSALYVKAGKYLQPAPKVKYRGLFINDEEPSFGQWSREKFGGINSSMYVHLFELLLRLKANYLWPAMWGKAFNEDDPMNPVLADEYGIVMGTSHHEPMMRAHKEYTSRKEQVGAWDYTANEQNLKKFFEEGLQRNKAFENLITIGMRGDGDVALGKGNDQENINVLRKVVADQRAIIQKVYGRQPAEVPQLWAIFTEVQRYYDAGLTVPDDVTLLFCDNNWGYIRRTGPLKEQKRKGGLGMYYHIDMNGGPWNDRWINTTTIPKLREQFNLAYQTGIDRIWIVNVGDLKPKELPIDFILRYAWNPEAVPADQVGQYTIDWATGIFGSTYAREIAEIVSAYPKYNLWRKPEVQHPRIFSFVNYNEADSVSQLWRNLVAKAEDLEKKMPAEARDAYYQLVLYPVKASAGVAEIYLAAGRNNLYAKQGRVSANEQAAIARALLEQDKQLGDYYNGPMANGKWSRMMQDIHIGYERWSMPNRSKLPELKEVTPLPAPAMGVAVEGSEEAWPGANGGAALPVFDAMQQQRYYIEVFNRGTGTFKYTAQAGSGWIKLNKESGEVEKQERLYVELDWKAVPQGAARGEIVISQGAIKIPVSVSAINQPAPAVSEPYFGNLTGEYSIPAHQFNASIDGGRARWIRLPGLGRGEAAMGIHPVTAPSTTPAKAPRLEYKIYLPASGKTTILLGVLPTQDVNPARGLRIAVAIDNGQPRVLDARKGFVDTFGEYTADNLSRSAVLKPLPPIDREFAMVSRRHPRRSEIFDNLRWLDVDLEVAAAGLHTLKVYMVDPELVLEQIVVNPDNRYPSYFGAPALVHNDKIGKPVARSGGTSLAPRFSEKKAAGPAVNYTNPVIWADVPDMSITRSGSDYYLISTTMHLMPGAPVMRSKDLVHWSLASYVFDSLTDHSKYNLVNGTVYGRGQWASSIRYHKGKYYVLFSPNDQPYRSYIYTTANPAGRWQLVSRTQHFHDASLFFDDDGRVYVFSGTGSLNELQPDLSGTKPGGVAMKIFERDPTETGLLEGSQVIKHKGKYYLLMISWPRGGKRRQVCYRADKITGPYEKKVILQDNFAGFPYAGQGAIIDDEKGNWYALIFQDRGGVGRVPLLMPCRWVDGWPMLGNEEGKVPWQASVPLKAYDNGGRIVQSDSFTGKALQKTWQWNHNPVNSAWSLTDRPGYLRLTTSRVVENLYLAPNTLTQRMEGPWCEGTIAMDITNMKEGDRAGFSAFNGHAGVLTVVQEAGKHYLTLTSQVINMDKDKVVISVQEEEKARVALTGSRIYLRIAADFNLDKDLATFYYSLDNSTWTPIGAPFTMRFDYTRHFMGTKFALFNYATKNLGGYVEVDFFHYQTENTKPAIK